jgi:hypothetical protein
MRRTLGAGAVVAMTLSAAARGQGGWKAFTSSSGFSVAYPGTWRRIGGSTDRLDILSSSAFAEGVVIAQGEAEIIVVEIRDSTGASLSALIDRGYSRDDSILSRRDVPGTGISRRCAVLTEVVSTEEVGPGARERDTVLYCRLNGRTFATTLRHWPGDERHAEYERTALRVARSLRLDR